MSKTNLIEATIRENLVSIRNNALYAALSQATIPVASENTSRNINLITNETTDLQVINADELTIKLQDYLSYESIIDLQASLDDDVVRELNLNWDSYQSIFDKLQGKNITLQRLDDIIIDATKASLNKKKNAPDQTPTTADLIDIINAEPVDEKPLDDKQSSGEKADVIDTDKNENQPSTENQQTSVSNIINKYFEKENKNSVELFDSVKNNFKNVINKSSKDNIVLLLKRLNVADLTYDQCQIIIQYDQEYVTQFNRFKMLTDLSSIDWTIGKATQSINNFNQVVKSDNPLQSYQANKTKDGYFKGKPKVLDNYVGDLMDPKKMTDRFQMTGDKRSRS